MSEFNAIEVRQGWKRYYLMNSVGMLVLMAIPFIVPSQRKESIDFVFGRWTLTKVPFILPFPSVFAYCLFNYFDNRIKLKVDQSGIWTKKYKLTTWNDIWYFYTTVCKVKEGYIYYLNLRLKDTYTRIDREIKIRYRRMDTEFMDVRSLIESYAKDYQIQDLGHEEEV